MYPKESSFWQRAVYNDTRGNYVERVGYKRGTLPPVENVMTSNLQ